MSSLETKQTRIVVEKIEEPDYWIVACVKLTEITLNDGSIIHTSAEMSPPEVLISDLRMAYRRWRLKNGTLSQNLIKLERQGLVDLLSSWWQAWSKTWQVFLNGSGVFRCNAQLGLRINRGGLVVETVRAIENILQHENKLIGNTLADMLIFKFDSTAETNGITDYGCVYKGNTTFTKDSTIDIFNWVTDCHDCCDTSSYLEPSGFVLHICSRSKQKQTRDSNLKDSSPTLPSDFLSSTTGLFKKNATDLVKSVESVGTMVDYINPFNYLPKNNIASSLATSLSKTPSTTGENSVSQQNSFPHDDLHESRFLVGLQGDLEDREDLQNGEITNSTVHLRSSENNKFSKYSLILYQRRPFIFVLIYQLDNEVGSDGPVCLTASDYYLALHRRLAALAEPILRDISHENLKNTFFEKLFGNTKMTLPAPKLLSATSSYPTSDLSSTMFMLILDPINATYYSNLPFIPEIHNTTVVQNQGLGWDPLNNGMFPGEVKTSPIGFGYIDCVHLHQQLCTLVLSLDKSSKSIQEKLVRTARNWWIYMASITVKINDQNVDRSVILIRKWRKQASKLPRVDNKDPNTNDISLVGAFGKEVHSWLETFKSSGAF
ncbi:hypothetical protein NADFUDRAFT_83579 [Nadsonia fulvescens var. elongata DSM 6958]|uniref:CCZ1/INTU/HSP4 first Longin domain-containing protein n=1 Tax=Nadsonia fulvescens var. elongata DSM 6958 TaxID=857566 RepID=A0A1E3PGX0_9ASCO|nr:hypothetical protein NADFUDRAFT_83579 [Nadsonia fulvescens var. elongata DSM 6958]